MQVSLGSLRTPPIAALLSRLTADGGAALNPMSLAALSASSAARPGSSAPANAAPGSVQPLPEPAYYPQPARMQRNPDLSSGPVATPTGSGAPQSLGGLSPRPQSLGELAPSQGSAPVSLNAQPYSPSGTPSLASLVNNLPAADLKKHTDWGKIIASALGVIGDGLSVYGGKQPLFGPEMARENELRMEEESQQNRLSQELAERRDVAMRPRTEQAGNTIGTFDPTTNSFTPVYTAPSAGEQYADALGYQPGSDEYKQAIQDYRLGSFSDPAVENRMALTGYRYDRSDAQLGQRLAVQTHGQELSHSDRLASIHQSGANNRYSADHRSGPQGRLPTPSTVIGGIMAKQASGQPLTPSEEGALHDYRTHYKPQRGAVQITPNEPIATGPNGQKLVVRNGQWVPAH